MKSLQKSIALALVFAICFSVFPVGALAHNVTFNYEIVTVEDGGRVQLPEAPVRDGYIFAGWYTTPEGGQYNAFNPAASVEGDITLYPQWIPVDHVRYLETTDGEKTVTLGYSTYSGVKLRRMDDNSEVPAEDLAAGQVDYAVFKDLNRNGVLDPYEDWRLDVESRTADLAAQMSYAEIAGLMLYSRHQRISSPIPTQDQIVFLANDDVKHVLIAGEVAAEIAAPWNNTVQAITESIGLGIPANNSSDPRHSAAIGVEYYSSNTGTISLWPNSLGLAATFDEDLVFEFGKIASIEYRALGISTALSPQIDISTEPRWTRFNGTFGEDPRLAADMTRAYVQGFQGTFDDDGNLLGWGYDSVNAMIKHWPGGGGGESGRDGHVDFGKYMVYPSDSFDSHLVPFVDGALQGTAAETTMATAVMPYYTISYNMDPSGQDLANGYSEFILTTLLRDGYNYDGVICTDWGVDTSRGWGPDIEDLSTTERSKLLIEAGVDQFGGQNTSRYILEAVELARAEGTEDNFRAKMEESAARLLKNIFRPGLFENPYLNVEKSIATVGNDEFVAKGYEAQVKSIVMLKNQENVLPLAPGTKVYIPAGRNGEPVLQGAQNFFEIVDTPEEADVALLAMNTPLPGTGSWGGGYSDDTGYVPLTLQFSEYTAVKARDTSIAGDYRNIEGTSKILDRSYKNKKTVASNIDELFMLLDTKEAMGDKPVITVINVGNPMVFSEVEPVSDAILLRFASSDNAVLDVVRGEAEPYGLLPFQLPKSMAVVETQFEDGPRDMDVYVDQVGNAYDFGFGLNWSGVINDERVAKYKVPVQTAPLVGSTRDQYVKVLTHTLPVGKIGEEYRAAIETVEDAELTLVDGVLPEGLSFNSGVISGVPTEGTHQFGNQLMVKVSARGKQDRIIRITLVVNETGAVSLADPNELSIAITLARAKKEANYTAESWKPFELSLGIAEAVYNSASTTTQVVLDSVTTCLLAAMDSLVRK